MGHHFTPTSQLKVGLLFSPGDGLVVPRQTLLLIRQHNRMRSPAVPDAFCVASALVRCGSFVLSSYRVTLFDTHFVFISGLSSPID